MANKTFYYARVSTTGQNLDRQLSAFRDLGAAERDIITDKATGTTFDRPGYQALKTALLRDGDTLVVKSLDRLGRNKAAIYTELQWLKENHIRLKVMDIPTTMMDYSTMDSGSATWVMDMVNSILMEVYASMAQAEYDTRAQRQAEGNAAMVLGEDGKKHSKRTGNAVGRPNATRPSNWDAVMAEYRKGMMTAKAAMAAMGLKHSTFYKLMESEA